MNSNNAPDTVDTRIVFRVYAALAAVAGTLLVVGLPAGLTADLVSDPGLKAAATRALGAFMLAVACVATGFAQIQDPRSRHNALRWFANAHLVLGAALLILIIYRGGPNPRDISLPILAAATLLLFYFWQTGDGHRAGESMGMIRLFAPEEPSADQLRSAYEERIRAAASQEERNRLARDLHDSIKQQIFAMQTAAATAQVRFDNDPAGARQALDRVRDSGREAMAEMEAMLENLRSAPLENVGLVEALKKQAEALHFRTGAKVHFQVGALPSSDALAPAAQQAIFRIAQEALSNVARHARATEVRVSLGSQGGRVVLTIEDNGAGFSPGRQPAVAGMGLGNMRTRAEAFGGTLEVRSRPSTGTVVSLRIPCASPPRPDISDYRRRVRTWAVQVVLMTLIAVKEAYTGEPYLLLFLALAGASAVVFVRAVVALNRARKLAESASWIESPSHS